MPELIITDSFSLLVHRQWVIAGALAPDSHAQDSARQEESRWIPKLLLAKEESHEEVQRKQRQT